MDRILQSHFFRLATVLGFMILAQGLATAQLLPTLTNVTTVASTIPANGDLNPYGVAQVPATQGKLVEGNILVSNFNNSSNPARNGQHHRANLAHRGGPALR